jgi:hypothetical protein
MKQQIHAFAGMTDRGKLLWEYPADEAADSCFRRNDNNWWSIRTWKFIMRNIIRFSFPLLIALVFAFFGISRLTAYKNYASLEAQDRQLYQEIQRIDTIYDPAEAADAYQKLKPAPEIQLRILQRQWRIALEIVHQIQLVSDNPSLKREIPMLFNRLKAQLREMKAQCENMIADKDALQGNIGWQLYNIKASASLLTAFAVLETESNTKKAMGMMKDAVSDFKLSVEIADSVKTLSFEKNIPRWNLEIIQGSQHIKKISQTELNDSEQRLELRDNLEAVIPEKGGYAPGEPLERTVRK